MKFDTANHGSTAELPTQGISLRAVACGILTAMATIGALRFGSFNPISLSLDASWVAAIGEAAARGDIFGRDLILTGGPLNALYTRYFDPVQWPFVLVAEPLIVCTFVWSCIRLASSWRVALLLPVSILFGSADGVLFAVPAFAALAALKRPKTPLLLILLAASATAAIVLAKFSPILIAAVSFGAIDIELVRERRPPIAMVSFIACTIGGFALLEGGAGQFPDFIRYSIATSAGYSAAMSISGSVGELISFLAFAAVVGAIVVFRAWQGVAAGAPRKSLLTVFVLGALGFTALKAGFVRHDLHSMVGWGAAALGLAAYAGLEERHRLSRFFVALSLTASAMCFVALWFNVSMAPRDVLESSVDHLVANFKGVVQLARNPRAWIRDRQRHMQEARDAVRAALPLPPIQGTVDVLPSIQSAVIAAGLDYRPRFTVQEYTTYTQALIEKNHASWFGPRAPDHILFGLSPIDGRLPALSEGAQWPDLLRYYEPTRYTQGLALLSHRAHPLPNLLGPATTRTARLGERFALGGEPAFLKLDIRYNWLGRLLSTLFKPPMVVLQLDYPNGAQEVYRIIPDMARAGFVVAPRVKFAEDFIVLAVGERAAIGSSAMPIGASVEVSRLGSFAYEKDIRVALQTIDLATLRAAQPAGLDIKDILHDLIARNRLVDAVRPQPPALMPVPEGLLAHAPRRISIPVDKARSVTLTFGFRAGAWNPGQTDGACFKALDQAGNVLWQRCLDPRNRPADRGRQTASFALPADQTQIVLETTCGASCNWDWTYWGELELK